MRLACFVLATTVALAAASAPTYAQQSVTIYRCTDANGDITVQNDRPCPKGTTQDKRVMAGVASGPPPSGLRPIVAGTPSAPPINSSAPATPAALPAQAPVIVSAPRLAPPTLFECRAFDGTLSLGESNEPTLRCAPLTSTGLDGNPALGAGQSCEQRADTCTAIPATDLCARWQQRLRDAQGAERFGNEAGRVAALADIDRAQRVLTESTCATQ